LEGAKLKNAKFCNTTMPNGSINNDDCVKETQEQKTEQQVVQPQENKVEVGLNGKDALKKLKENKSCVSCDLRNAKLQEANLSGANLKDADLRGSKLRGAKFCNTTMADGLVNNDDC